MEHDALGEFEIPFSLLKPGDDGSLNLNLKLSLLTCRNAVKAGASTSTFPSLPTETQ